MNTGGCSAGIVKERTQLEKCIQSFEIRIPKSIKSRSAARLYINNILQNFLCAFHQLIFCKDKLIKKLLKTPKPTMKETRQY